MACTYLGVGVQFRPRLQVPPRKAPVFGTDSSELSELPTNSIEPFQTLEVKNE